MKLIFKHSETVFCYLIEGEYYVYGVTSDPRVCHSEGAARSIAGV